MGDLTSLEGFRLTKVLNSDDRIKAIDVLGRCGTGSLKADLRSVEEQMEIPFAVRFTAISVTSTLQRLTIILVPR